MDRVRVMNRVIKRVSIRSHVGVGLESGYDVFLGCGWDYEHPTLVREDAKVSRLVVCRGPLRVGVISK